MTQKLTRKLLPAIQSKRNILFLLVINTVKTVLLQAFLFSKKKQPRSLFFKILFYSNKKDKKYRITSLY